MGKVEYERLEEAHEAPERRKKHYREFIRHLSDEQAGVVELRVAHAGVAIGTLYEEQIAKDRADDARYR
jgi:uncharacterized protein involved in propanediol utilization